jgi:hypothetical protein
VNPMRVLIPHNTVAGQVSGELTGNSILPFRLVSANSVVGLLENGLCP